MTDAAQWLRSLGTQMSRWGASRSAGASPPHPPICHDIKAWCAEHPEGEYRIITPAKLILRQPPRTIESSIHPSFEALCRVEIPARALVHVAGARLLGASGLIVLPDGSLVGELVALTAPGQKGILEGQAAYHEPLPRTVTHKRGRYYPLFAIGWRNYYHWNHDVLMPASRILEHLPSDIRFVVPPRLQPFQYEPLQLLGIDSSRIETVHGDGVWDFDSLFFSTPIMKTQIDTREPLEWFKRTALERFDIPPPRRRRRIHVSRRLDHHHRTVNEQEVEALLRAHDFETVIPGTLSFRDQVALFAEADILVGTGSGLNANLVFAPVGARVLQFQDPTHVINAVWTMAESLGHRYWYIMCEAVPNPGRHANIFVPIAKLKKALDLMLSEASP